MTYTQSPPVLYIGDAGRLIVRFDELDAPFSAPPSPSANLVLGETLISGQTMTINFTAFAPGSYRLYIPGNEEAGPVLIEVASLLEGDTNQVFSPMEAPLPASGTMPLLFGVFLALALIIVLAVLSPKRLFPGIKRWYRDWQKRKRLRAFEKLLEESRGKPPAEAVEGIDRAFRKLLEFFCGFDCLPLTAPEFATVREKLPLADFDYTAFFRLCDALRFGGRGDVSSLYSALEEFKAGCQ
jgi:hypothetical protein